MTSRIRNLFKSAVVFGVTGGCVGGVDAAMLDDVTQWSEPAKLTSSDLRQLATVIEDKNFDLTQAIRTAKRQCDGTVIMAQGKVIDAQKYQQKFQSGTRAYNQNDRNYNENENQTASQSGRKVVFEITCADENMAANHIAVLPDTGEVKLVRAEMQRDRFGRQVSDRERMDRTRRDFDDDRYDRTRTWDDDDDYDRTDRDFAWDDWDGDGRRHEVRSAWNRDDNYDDDNDDWSWGNEQRGAVGMGLIRKASDVIGANVENINGENLGEIEDLAVDARTGQIRYAVLSFGGFLGIGDKLFAVPWTAFTKQDESTYVLHVDKDRLENAPGFEKTNWPNMADARWGSEVHAFYNVRPYWDTQTNRFQDNQYDRTRSTQRDRYNQDDRYAQDRSERMNRTQRDRFDDDDRYSRTQTAQRDRYEQGDRHTNTRDFDRNRFTQTGMGSNLHNTCVRALENNDFELTDAIQKAESETNGQAISARCQLASQTQSGQTQTRTYDTDDKFNQDDDDNQQGRTTQGSSKVLIEVATFTEGDTQTLRIVTISPETGEVIRTRNQNLSSSGTRSDAGLRHETMAGSN